MGNEQLQEKYQAFVRNSSEGIWLCELDEPISITLPPLEQIKLMYERAYLAEANDAMARMDALESGEQLIGTRLGDLLVESDPQNTAYLQAFIESGYRLSGVESHEKDSRGDDRIFRNSLVGVVENGFVLRAWGTQQDVTEQYAMHQELQRSQERLTLALKASRVGLWEWDTENDIITWTDEMYRLFGLSPGEPIEFGRYESMLHPDDRGRMTAKINESRKTGEEYQVEHRVVWPDGSVHWMLGMGRAIIEDGHIVRMAGTAVSLDDTKRKNELEEINRKLKKQQEELVQINRTKDEFIALASHQLRTPATVVKQYISMLTGGYFGALSKAQLEAAQTALQSNERQLAIVNDLLWVAQLDSGNLVLRKQKEDISALVRSVTHDHVGKFETKGQQLIAELPASPVFVAVDKGRLHMVIENLVDNAFKYSSSDKPVRLRVKKTAKKVIIQVIDEGVGIRKADIPRLFQKFSRLKNAMSDEAEGTGLGLYWAREIVNLHGGTLTVESKVHKGTTFTITLPVA